MKRRLTNARTIASNVDGALIARICWQHFREGLTQQEVADRIGLSRATVNKIINDACRNGLVQVSINAPNSPCLELESKLKTEFNLIDAVVVPSPLKESDIWTVVGLAAGDYVSRNLKKGEILGLAWGATIHAAVRAIEPRSDCRNAVVSLSGGLAKSTRMNPYDNAAMFARVLDAECYYITAPMLADSPQIKSALLSSASLKIVLEMAKKIDLALLTAVDLTPKARIKQYGVLTPDIFQSLIDAGSVGSICDHYLDSKGQVLKHPVNERTISVPLEIVKTVPRRVLAAGGIFKIPIINAIMEAKLCNVLITDESAARTLLRKR